LPKLFLGVLALAWIGVLVPPVLRARNDSKARGDSIGDFQNRLGVLGRSHSARRRAARSARTARNLAGRPGAARAPRGVPRGPAPGVAAPPMRTARATVARPLTGPVEPLRTRASERSSRRRREVVTVLFTATILTAAIAAALGGLWWGLQLVTDLVFVSYVVGMVWFRSVAADRMRTVRYLPPVRPRPVPAYALRRTGSS
jgi:hypothetical protein